MKTYHITTTSEAQEQFDLPAPVIAGGVPLMDALHQRRSRREFSNEPITDQQLSDLLWAAFGVNKRVEFRDKLGMRTAPTARNNQEIDVYVFLPSGVYLYDGWNNRLILVRGGNYRTQAGTQEFYAEVPLALCIVADFDRMGSYTEEQKVFYSAVDAGYVSQNIYLYCESAGLATVACGRIDRERLSDILKLGNAKAMLSHPVGKNV